MAQGSKEEHPLGGPPEDLEQGCPAGKEQPPARFLGCAGLSPAPTLPKSAAPRQARQCSCFTACAGAGGDGSGFLWQPWVRPEAGAPGAQRYPTLSDVALQNQRALKVFQERLQERKQLGGDTKATKDVSVFYLSQRNETVPAGSSAPALSVTTSRT